MITEDKIFRAMFDSNIRCTKQVEVQRSTTTRPNNVEYTMNFNSVNQLRKFIELVNKK